MREVDGFLTPTNTLTPQFRCIRCYTNNELLHWATHRKGETIRSLRKGVKMYYQNSVTKKIWSIYTWGFLVSQTIGRSEVRKHASISSKLLPPNPDGKRDLQGNVQPWPLGPPINQRNDAKLALNIGTPEKDVIPNWKDLHDNATGSDRVEARPNHCSFDEHVERTGKRGWNQTYAPCHWGGPPHILG